MSEIITDPVVVYAWKQITRSDDTHTAALVMRDYVMEHANCERDEAVKLLADVGIARLKIRDCERWNYTPSKIIAHLSAGKLEKAKDDARYMRSLEEGESVPERHHRYWLAWLDRAEKTIEIIQTLRGEATC